VTFSPDGNWAVLMAALAMRAGRLERKLLLTTPDGSTRKLLDIDAGRIIRFAPDGSGLADIVRENGADNIRIQPLDGSPSRRITAFTTGRIAGFRWSPDGSKLAVQRQRRDSDVVLLRDGEAGRQ
jgi:Tol biopolymer transport system component